MVMIAGAAKWSQSTAGVTVRLQVAGLLADVLLVHTSSWGLNA